MICGGAKKPLGHSAATGPGAHHARTCPACGDGDVPVSVVRMTGIPAQSAVLVESAAAAVAFPNAEMDLVWCASCGLAYNAAFDEASVNYSGGYEVSQAGSPTFTRFAGELSVRWIVDHGLQGGHVVEIGCGNGDFLRLFCKEGDCTGVGYDPAYMPAVGSDLPEGVCLLPRPFDEGDAPLEADFIVCRHTLEHVGPVSEFLSLMRRACGESTSIRLGFEVPDLTRILTEGAFWDIYHEHAAYFTYGSLSRAFEAAGFNVLSVRRVFGDQYLILDAAPRDEGSVTRMGDSDDLAETRKSVEAFAQSVAQQMGLWRAALLRWKAADLRICLWGSGSKAVGFLTALGGGDDVDCVVDINPQRQGFYMPGVNAPIVAPEYLKDSAPDVVIVMNPRYRDEISLALRDMGLSPLIFTPENVPEVAVA